MGGAGGTDMLQVVTFYTVLPEVDGGGCRIFGGASWERGMT